jgi:hypothetical protein
MNPKTEIATQAIRRIFKNSGAYSEKQVQEITFHLTDWIDDLTPFANFLNNPETHKDEEAMQIIVKFLAHAPDHLKIAADHVLDPERETQRD